MKPTRALGPANPRGTEFVGRGLRLRQLAGFTLHRVRDDPARDVQRHSHSLAHFCLLLDRGYSTRAHGGERCSRGTAIFHPPGTVHDDRFQVRGGSFLTVTIEPEGQRSLEALSPFSGGSLALTSPRAGLLVERLAIEDMRAGPSAELGLESLLFELAGLFVDAERIPLAWLGPGLERLEDDPDSIPSVSELARLCDVHPVSLARAFRLHLGMTPGDCLRFLRLQRVLPDLSTSRRPLVDLALAAGYSDQSAFTRAFRGLFGISPGRYRRLLQGLRSIR